MYLCGDPIVLLVKFVGIIFLKQKLARNDVLSNTCVSDFLV